MPDGVLGIDGGGSKTLALLAAADGRVLGRGEAGPSNYQVIGLDAALAALEAAVAAALANAGCGPRDRLQPAWGWPASTGPTDRERLAAWAAVQLPGAPVAQLSTTRNWCLRPARPTAGAWR